MRRSTGSANGTRRPDAIDRLPQGPPMTDPITKLFRRSPLTFWRRPALDLSLVLRSSRRGHEWLPLGWHCDRIGEGWDRSYPWYIRRHLPRELAIRKGSTEVLRINDTQRTGYRRTPVSGPLLDLLASGDAPEGIAELITASLRKSEQVGREVKERHEIHLKNYGRRRKAAEHKPRQGPPRQPPGRRTLSAHRGSRRSTRSYPAERTHPSSEPAFSNVRTPSRRTVRLWKQGRTACPENSSPS